MGPSSWKHLGHLTPDIPELQREVWALLARIQQGLAQALQELADRTAEPTWAAALGESAARAVALAEALAAEAGEVALAAVQQDELVGELDAALAEVLGSGHVPSLIATGYVVLGELGAVPARLLEGTAGPHGRLLVARVVAAEPHRVLAGLLELTHPGPRERDELRRMLRHLDGLLFAVYQSWRQTFHSLGVDGEWIDETSRDAVHAALDAIGLNPTRADLRVFGAG